jgi:hypothetical protein
MSFIEFAGEVQITRLFQHGRHWEIFLNGASLGYGDGSQEEALAQVHQREVNNALYANSPDAPDWMEAAMPTPEVLAEYPQIAARFPGVVANGSSKTADPKEIPLSHEQFNAYIEKSFFAMDDCLRQRIAIPSGHAWLRIGQPLRWNMNDPLRSSLSGASLFIGLVPANAQDEHQFSVEIRYFWQRRTLQRPGKAEVFGEDRHRAIVWVEQGRPFAGMQKSLLAQSASFFYADTIAALADEVAAAVNVALANAVETQSEVSAAVV